MVFTLMIRYIVEHFLFLIGYMGSIGGAFPKPLSAKEEEMYFKLYREGDEDAKNVLIERNLRLVVHVAKKYATQWSDSDDLISIGAIGLMKAVSTYDYEKGHRFATYAAKCVQNEILMYLRSLKKTQNEISLDEQIGSDKDGNSISLIDILESDQEETVEQVDFKMRVKELYGKIEGNLTSREKKIIGMRYGLSGAKEKTQKEVAKELNISRSYVSRIEKKAVEKLRANMKDNTNDS